MLTEKEKKLVAAIEKELDLPENWTYSKVDIDRLKEEKLTHKSGVEFFKRESSEWFCSSLNWCVLEGISWKFECVAADKAYEAEIELRREQQEKFKKEQQKVFNAFLGEDND